MLEEIDGNTKLRNQSYTWDIGCPLNQWAVLAANRV